MAAAELQPPGCPAVDVVGWQRMAAGQYPWQSGRASKPRGRFRDNVSGDPKSCTGPGHSVLRPPGNQHTEPDHPGFPSDHLQAPRQRSLFHLSPVSSLTPCAIIIKSVSSV